ncbi:VirB4 family type IV secretion/conjugal transfer ATPase [Desulfovibrio sp. JC022]|uniref:VirB4 family type IV secretion/conjugal transfer ATPase n=1 Tax=Desulfovibrio sp. JC022 TaxID=2593642 RepID=UPI0013D453A1|nr:VirB4 family type IV secretion/conjugal transfer ATPase [Desulfovibrio sp. JC022]NDV24838.1 VirB4 family type IV secretion/conjugal transfer ATPase [Desulfovibrio sp. JC022]
MIALKDYRHKPKGLSDLLPYAAMVNNGVLLCKDGSLMTGWKFRAQDTASSTAEELAVVSNRVNSGIKNLDSGWMLHVEAIRSTATEYPHAGTSFFPDFVTQAIEDERRNIFESAGTFYSTETYLIITYKPEFLTQKLSNLAYENSATVNHLEKALEKFLTVAQELEDSLSLSMELTHLADIEFPDEHGNVHTYSTFLSLLNKCLTGEEHPILLPKIPMYLDALLGGQDLTGGLQPSIGGRFIKVLAVDGFPPDSWPSMLSNFESLPIEYRFSTRFICMDQYEAQQELEKYRKTWSQQIYKIWDQLKDNANAKENRDAKSMADDAEQAIEELQSGLVGAGFYTAVIVLMSYDLGELEENTRELRRKLLDQGFPSRIEGINALEAWLGSHPGNSYANVRRPIINTMNLADLLPLATIWAGREHNPSDKFPPSSPPLMYCATNGSTPFRLNLHVSDIGHTLIFGPTGAGKSTLLGILAAQFRRYQKATIFAFDKGKSMLPLCLGAGGSHYEIAADDSLLSFAPLQHVDSDAEQSWAEEWIETLATMQGLNVLPAHRNAIHIAMSMIRNNPEHMRSMTDFYHSLQNEELREAIKHYTGEGAMGRLLDASSDDLGISDFMVFEIEELMNLGDKNIIPVLLYLFHRIEKALSGQPALLILDEAWIMLGHKVFREKIREWLKVLRKANCAVVLATQSLSDASRSGILDVLVESCPTKIYLPNPAAIQEAQYKLYQGLGLNSRQIEIIASATPKRDYYVVSPEGRRLIELALGPVALSFVGASDKASLARIKKLASEHGADWPEHWLNDKIGDFK